MNIVTIPSLIELTEDGIGIATAALPCIIEKHFSGDHNETNEREFQQYISTQMESVIYHFATLALVSNEPQEYLDEKLDTFGAYLSETYSDIHDYSDGLWCPENGEHVLFEETWIVPSFNDGAVFRSQLDGQIRFIVQKGLFVDLMEKYHTVNRKFRKLQSKNAKTSRKK